jgi:putative integral membrane protein (TIGR02587 family)
VAIDSVEEVGLGLVLSAGILYILGRLTREMPLSEIVGKIVIEAMTVAIGVSVGTAQLGGSNRDTGSQSSDGGTSQGSGQSQQSEGGQGEPKPQQPQPDTVGQLVLGFCGAVLIASNVAPTEEIVVLGIEAPPTKILGVAILSIALCALVLFYSGFAGSDHHVRRGAKFWTAYGIVSSYTVALLASALMLWFFGRFDGASLEVMVAETVVLAFPAAMGASAGRLLIQ